jgi:hypothetical protein
MRQLLQVGQGVGSPPHDGTGAKSAQGCYKERQVYCHTEHDALINWILNGSVLEDLEGKGRGLLEVLPRHLPIGTEEYHDKPHTE